MCYGEFMTHDLVPKRQEIWIDLNNVGLVCFLLHLALCNFPLRLPCADRSLESQKVWLNL